MKKYTLVILITAITFSAWAQYEPIQNESTTNHQASKFSFGGGLGLSFGRITNIEISPRVSYRALPRLSVGVGASYIYYNNKYYHYESNIYGLSSFASFDIVKDLRNIFPTKNPSSLVLHFETNWLNLPPEMDFTANPQRNNRFWLVQPQIGLGLKIPFGTKSYGVLFILYNINEQIYSPYQNPVLTYYIMF